MVTVSVEDVSGERLRLKVTDTDLGISREKMVRFFTPFDRLGTEESGIEGTGFQGGLGLELAKEHRARRIPVVVLNADATSGQKRLLADGAREFLTKPLDVKQLFQVLDELLLDAALTDGDR